MYSSLKNFILEQIIGAPIYHLILEFCLGLWVLWLLRRKKKRPEVEMVPTPQEEEEILAAWQPKPLVGDIDKNMLERVWGQIQSAPGKYVTIDGERYLNMCTDNYLNLMENKDVIKEAKNCVRKYGVGSCGPRGFFGTVDVHLQLEETISNFMHLEETALYSYGIAAISSAIPSYAKAGDIIFADEQVSFPIQKGLQASKSQIQLFKHNDAKDLVRLLEEQRALDVKYPKLARSVRRFCVVEGIYAKTGSMCPLGEIAKVCKKYKVRLFLDETHSIGVIGDRGLGVTEYLSVPRKCMDFISGSLETAFGTFGGFISGSSYVVDHQRISGIGYCFSASLPPMLAGAGLAAFEILRDDPTVICDFQYVASLMFRKLGSLTHFYVNGHPLAPFKHITLKMQHSPETRDNEKQLLGRVVKFMKSNKVAVVQPSYLEDEEMTLPVPSIRLSVCRLFNEDDILRVTSLLERSITVKDILNCRPD